MGQNGHTQPRPGGGTPLFIVRFPDRRQKMIDLIRKGMPYRHAARGVRCTEQTFHNTMARGREVFQRLEAGVEEVGELEQNDAEALEFLEAVHEAESAFVDEMLGRVTDAAKEPKNWGAAMGLLERRYPGDFALPPKTLVQHITVEQQATDVIEAVRRMDDCMEGPPDPPLLPEDIVDEPR